MSMAAGGTRMIRARHRLMARGVVAATGRMVRLALAGDWREVSTTLAVRRELFERLQNTAIDPRELSCVRAMQAALRESDRAFVEAACNRIERKGAARRKRP